jgi:AbrB family looped-hinge helix DNA binding protein
MQTAVSKLTKKYQATIPELVRQSLALKAGDSVAFDLNDGHIELRKAQTIDMTFSQSLGGTLAEWESKFDEKAYHDL